jgi:hypothetical protein
VEASAEAVPDWLKPGEEEQPIAPEEKEKARPGVGAVFFPEDLAGVGDLAAVDGRAAAVDLVAADRRGAGDGVLNSRAARTG